MTIAELPRRLALAQQTLRFKVIATVLLAALSIGSFVAWAVYINAPATREAQQKSAATPPAPAANSEQKDAAAPSPPVEKPLEVEDVRQLLGSRTATPAVAAGIFGATGLAILVVWLGLGLTYLGLMLLGGLVAAPLYAFEATRSWGQLLAGVIALIACFTVLMQALRILFSAKRPSIAIARNVLAEAVRMKISVVFIVMLMLLLAALPGALDADQPLRYRVQSFLQYSVSGAYWVLALMTVFFASATVAFEQRDRVIWQTMAKPVTPLQYLFGKWLGVVGLNAVLLAVAAGGVFLFTEHLRGMPAQGEERPFVSAAGGGSVAPDRVLLHSQVLVARVGVQPIEEEMPREELLRAVENIVKDSKDRDPTIDKNKAAFEEFKQKIALEQLSQWKKQLRTIRPGQAARFVFEGLQEPKRLGLPLTLLYKIQSGSNDPSALYRVTFRIAGTAFPAQVVLNTPQSIPFRPDAIDAEGRVVVEVLNGDAFTGRVNQWAMTFPPKDLEILYVAGGYEMNFARIMIVLWAKLAFLAAVAIGAATFLSFPVAALLAMLVLFASETAGFLSQSLDYFNVRETSGEINWFHAAIHAGAWPVAWAFENYAKMRPTANLVDGRLVGWASVARTLFVLAIWSTGVMGIGWLIFRRRELATYSGH